MICLLPDQETGAIAPTRVRATKLSRPSPQQWCHAYIGRHSQRVQHQASSNGRQRPPRPKSSPHVQANIEKQRAMSARRLGDKVSSAPMYGETNDEEYLEALFNMREQVKRNANVHERFPFNDTTQYESHVKKGTIRIRSAVERMMGRNNHHPEDQVVAEIWGDEDCAADSTSSSSNQHLSQYSPGVSRKNNTSATFRKSGVDNQTSNKSDADGQQEIWNNMGNCYCDLYGPRMCYHCIKVDQQEKALTRFDTVSNLQTSEANFAAASIVKQHLPDLHWYDIEAKLARGDITRPSFDIWLNRLKEAEERKKNEATKTEKITDGLTDEMLLEKYNSTKAGHRYVMSISERLAPMFVSNRSQKPQRTRFTGYFAPPIIPIQNQNLEPSFFAGSDVQYKLPPRLPENKNIQYD